MEQRRTRLGEEGDTEVLVLSGGSSIQQTAARKKKKDETTRFVRLLAPPLGVRGIACTIAASVLMGPQHVGGLLGATRALDFEKNACRCDREGVDTRKRTVNTRDDAERSAAAESRTADVFFVFFAGLQWRRGGGERVFSGKGGHRDLGEGEWTAGGRGSSLFA